MSKSLLLLIVLIEGFITISAEILTLRQLAPIIGNSIVVTSLIIGVFLLFLAYGYRRGGQYTENYTKILKKNFTFASMGLGVGLSYSFVDLFFYFFKNYLFSNVLVVLCSYLLLVIAPLVYILGQTIPITMNLPKQESTVGAIGGKILHLNTIGSFLGAVLTSLVLMYYWGVAWTVFINCILSIILVILLSSKSKIDLLRIVGLCCMCVLIYELNITLENQIFVKTNTYANYRVIDNQETKTLQINGSQSSSLTLDKQGLPYIELIKRILFNDLKLKHKDILVLGAGGFTLSAGGENDNRFVYLDIDKDIEGIVKKHFLADIKGKFTADDARSFLNENPHAFDVIVSDVYSNHLAIPPQLLTREYFQQIKAGLREHGVAIINILARPTLEDTYSWRIDNTIRSVFQHCMVMPLQYSSNISNIIYVCKIDKNKINSNYTVYSDNINKAALDFFNAITNKKIP